MAQSHHDGRRDEPTSNLVLTFRRGLVQEKLKRHLRMRSVINVRQGNRFRTLVETICYIRLSWSYCLQVYNLHSYMVTSTSKTSTHTSLDSVWNSMKNSDVVMNEIGYYYRSFNPTSIISTRQSNHFNKAVRRKIRKSTLT